MSRHEEILDMLQWISHLVKCLLFNYFPNSVSFKSVSLSLSKQRVRRSSISLITNHLHLIQQSKHLMFPSFRLIDKYISFCPLPCLWVVTKYIEKTIIFLYVSFHWICDLHKWSHFAFSPKKKHVSSNHVRNFNACCYMCHWDTNLKVLKSSRLPILPSLILKELFKVMVELCQFNHKNASYRNIFSQNATIYQKNSEKCILVLSFTLSGNLVSWPVRETGRVCLCKNLRELQRWRLAKKLWK